MTIAEIAKERGVTAQEVFVGELEKRDVLQYGCRVSSIDYCKIGTRDTPRINSTVYEEYANMKSESGVSFKKIPYTAITIALINAVAGEPK